MRNVKLRVAAPIVTAFFVVPAALVYVTLVSGAPWANAAAMSIILLAMGLIHVAFESGVSCSKFERWAILGLAVLNVADQAAFYRAHPFWLAVTMIVAGVLVFQTEKEFRKHARQNAA